MGTNYYAVRNRPTLSEPIHIGKSTLGWLFLFQAQNQPWNDPPVIWNSYYEVKEWLKKYTVDCNDYVIIDEEDEVISFDDFFTIVDSKQSDEHERRNPDNFKHCRNVDGYRFVYNDFS